MIISTGKKYNSEDFYKVIFTKDPILIAESTINRMTENFSFLKSFSKGKVIYGINTGLGPMAQFKINENEQVDLQYNLIRSHSTGMGSVLDEQTSRSVMLARLISLSQGYSGISPETVQLLAELINLEIYPHIYDHGGVGASGDLIQLAHLALGLIGEGKCRYKGKDYPIIDVMTMHNLNPIQIQSREGLAILNGTSAMTGLGVINLLNAKNLLNWSLSSSAMIMEMVESFDDHYSESLNKVKPHKGQNDIAFKLRSHLEGSSLIRKRATEAFHGENGTRHIKTKVQEYYSIRCVPQILGPIHETIEKAEEIIHNEINSVSDNPIVDDAQNEVFHGGNFHGDYISFEMDKLKIAVAKLSVLSERQLNFLMNDKLNQILPPFLNLGTLGLNLGMQGSQFVATSTTAENLTLSFPMYLHNIPSNNDNQDVVSMGFNSALLAKKVIENTYQVVSVLALAITQGISYLKIRNELSAKSNAIFRKIRSLVPVFTEDQILSDHLKIVNEYLLNLNRELVDTEFKNEINYEQEEEICPGNRSI
ncbi:aromatic amino acid lyase [Marivirga sp. S37H4]|uniref:Aromatic amino acid lyase n=1 Tax=Marivirga aurantiaca TaxID=2802615 RepID=A0A935C846_9BACT|nr:aromatic amino acid ammonia-lyase [Marivirga aurantiaca]MBK6265300.1 aromatic amino acid lyase [Marivirga aurantiaca]